MRNFVLRVWIKIKANLSSVAMEGIVISLILGVVILLMGSNIIRIFTNGQSNYTTFIQEKNEQERLKSKNQKLQEELNYVSSDEYKQLFLRDSQNLAQNKEELFKTKEKPKYYEEVPDYLDLKNKNNFSDWWGILVL